MAVAAVAGQALRLGHCRSLVVVECEAGSAGRGEGRRTWPTGAYAATIIQPPDAAGLVHLHFEAATSGQAATMRSKKNSYKSKNSKNSGNVQTTKACVRGAS